LTTPGGFSGNNPRKVTPAHRHLIDLDILIVADIVIILVTFANIDRCRDTERL